MKQYDPNISFATQMIHIKLMLWDYSNEYAVMIKGNCKGAKVLSYAIEQLADNLYEEYGENPELTLVRPVEGDENGEQETLITVFSDSDQNSIEDWLSRMCVELRIVEQLEE